MTLTDARSRAVAALKAAHLPPALSDRIAPIDGAVTGKEVQRQQVQLPSVQVAVLGRSDDGIRLAVYVVADARVPAVHGSALELLDVVEKALRELPGSGRALLEVRTQALYDADLMAHGGVALWAVTAAWPDLAGVADSSAETGGLIEAANELLAPAIDAALGLDGIDEQDAVAVADRKRRRGMTERDRTILALEGPLPYAEVRHGPGAVRGSGSGRARWPAGEAGRPLGPAPAVGQSQTRQAARGTRAWTASITLWAGTTAQVDTGLTELLRLLPRRWRWRGQENLVTVGRLDGPTYVASAGAFRAGAEVELAAVALAGEPAMIRTIRGGVVVRPGSADPKGGHVAPLNRARYVRPGGE